MSLYNSINSKLLIYIACIFIVSCGDSYKMQSADTFVSTLKGYKVQQTQNGTAKVYSSTSAGNLMASAIKDAYNLDVVFYPRTLINDSTYAFVHPNMTSTEVDYLLELFPKNGTQDQFMIGLMDGRAIKELIRTRTQDTFNVDVEVAGLVYNINLMAGVVQNATFELANGRILDDHKTYRVAINQYFWFSGETFPSYKYRNGLSFSFVRSGVRLSARETLINYLAKTKLFPYLDNKRATVVDFELKEVGRVKTYDIQGQQHRSPLWGKKVITSGVVTAVSNVKWFPQGMDMIIQDPQGDGIDESSDALNLHIKADYTDVKVGDLIEVAGTVWERMTLEESQNMSKTVLRNITDIKIISHNNPLPAPVLIGFDGRYLPDQIISTYQGNLNFKQYLKLTDGIDFWESLEGMRVKVKNPRITGFIGGHENLARRSVQRYVTLFILPDGKRRKFKTTNAGGQRENFMLKDYTPEVIPIWMGNLSQARMITPDQYYNVGDIFEGEVVGNISYEMSLFGGGDYSLVLPIKDEGISQTTLKRRTITTPSFTENVDCSKVDPSVTHWPIQCRPQTTLKGEGRDLTVATYNLKNLSSNEDGTIDYGNVRMTKMGTSIRFNLRCPDILNLVEVQDDNGQDLQGGTGATRTINNIIKYSKCEEQGVIYKAINIDPINHSEGGQPGGNIRVAMLYNSARVKFKAHSNLPFNTTVFNRQLRETTITKEGDLSTNPGRIFPLSKQFKNTRKSIIAQFEFRGEKLFIIGNHLNSKLGDSSFWGERQPPYIHSDEKRHASATLLAQFARIINMRNKGKANVILLGDFNAHYNERSMKALVNTGNLTNLMFDDRLTPWEERYSHNFSGESSAIDFIFASRNLMYKNPKLEPIHINTDFMGRLSDHDPVVSRFTF